jgi:hypothetical protein
MASDQTDAGKSIVLGGVESELISLQYLIWPSVENMNASPEWLMPLVGKQETSPYDMLIDLVPWYVSKLFPRCWLPTNSSTGLKYASYYINIPRNIQSDISSA